MRALRRKHKIKTSVILFAWFVIFAHGIIPHDHFQENAGCCNVLTHALINDIDDSESLSTIENLPEDSNVCHFSNLLYHQFSQDNLGISTNKEACFYPEAISGILFIERSGIFFAEPYYGCSSMRAPPAV